MLYKYEENTSVTCETSQILLDGGQVFLMLRDLLFRTINSLSLIWLSMSENPLNFTGN